MINRGLSLRYLSIGQLAITQGSTKYASCALFNHMFALMPSYIMKGIHQDQCSFEYKNASFQTNQKKKPIKILYSSQSCLSIVIFNQSSSIINHLQSLAIEVNAQEARRVDRYQADSVYAHGYLIEYGLINRQVSYESKRKTLNCPYRIIMGKQIHYDCPEKKDGMIGAALCLDEQDWIGIHYAGQNNYGYGILFIPQVIEQLINLMKTYYSYPNPKSIPTPEIYFKQDFMSTRQQTQDYQQIFEQFYDSLNSQLMETYDSLYFNI